MSNEEGLKKYMESLLCAITDNVDKIHKIPFNDNLTAEKELTTLTQSLRAALDQSQGLLNSLSDLTEGSSSVDI